jgi:putative hydrolase of the HAD superfamily
VAVSGVRALVCDLDGVVRQFDTRALGGIERAAGLADGTILAVALDPRNLGPAVRGAVQDDAWRAGVAAELASMVGERRARIAIDAWSRDIGALDPDVLVLLEEVRRSHPVVLLTNATSRLRSDLSSLGLIERVDAVVSSAEIGYPKPEPEAFEAAQVAVERLVGQRLAPEEVLFVDDEPRHVHAGVQRGWTAIRFTGAADLALSLRRLGLLGEAAQLPSGNPPR